MVSPRSHSSRRNWILVVALIAVALAGYLGWRHFDARAGGAAAQGGGQPAPPVPVTFATVQTADFPVYLNGPGIV